MKLLKTLQNNLITVSIILIMLLITSSGVLDMYNRTIQKENETSLEWVKQNRYARERLSKALNLVDLGVRGFYISPQEEMLAPMNYGKTDFADYTRIIKELDLNAQELAPVEKAFQDYFVLMDTMIQWRKDGNLAAIDSVIKLDPGYQVWYQSDQYDKKCLAKEDVILADSQAITEKIKFASSTLNLLMVLIGVPTLCYVLYRLYNERKRRAQLFSELDLHNKKYIFDPKEETGTALDERKVISALTANLKKAADYISNIASGNYTVQWEGLNKENQELNKSNLVGELWRMRDQMAKVKEEDSLRIWATEGISKFSEIVRRHQDDMGNLSDEITSNIVKYMKANQASLFFVTDKGDGQQVLDLYGCYAYSRKKHQEKFFYPGEGLVGQAYLEAETVYLTDIPQDYIKITSGLGEATPNSIIIIPLKFNDKVEGVLELASFTPLQSHEITFLEKIGEIIASAIVYIKAAAKMKEVMETMQFQSEGMKTQEEEMRQNMEELVATQEEISRKVQEYQTLLEERDEKIKALESRLQTSIN